MAVRRRYAEDTLVPVAQSRQEIHDLLARYGATAEGVNQDHLVPAIIIVFRLHERHIRITQRLPRPDEARFTKGHNGYLRHKSDAIAAYEQELRRVWRTLVLQLKARLEAAAD